MSYPKTRQNFVEYRQTRSNNPLKEYGEEYQYEEYVHRGTNQPSGYKREIRYVKGGPNQEEFYEDRITPLKDKNAKSSQISKQVVTSYSRTLDNKNLKNQPKSSQREYNKTYEMRGYTRTQNQNEKNVKKGYATSPNVGFPQRGGNAFTQSRTVYTSNVNTQQNQKNFGVKNYNTNNNTTQQKNSRNVYISGQGKNQPKNQTKNQSYNFQKSYQTTLKNSNSLPKYSRISNDFNKKDNLKQNRQNIYTPNKNNDVNSRKVDILKAEKRIRKKYNDTPNPNQDKNQFDTKINHNIYEIKQVTRELITVAEDPNNININFHRYSYGKTDPNVVNTVSHTIDETSKEPKKQVQVNPRKQETIKAVKHYRKMYNDSSTGNINQNQSYNYKNNDKKSNKFSTNVSKNQYNRGGSNPKNNQKNKVSSSYSFNRNLNINNNNNYNRYNKNNSNSNNKYSYQASKTTTTQNTYLRSNQNKLSKDDNPNKKINSVVYSRKGISEEPKKNVTTTSYMKSTTTTTTMKPNLQGKGFVVSTETQKVTKTTGVDGKTKESVEVKKEEKVKNDGNQEEGNEEEGEVEEGVEEGVEEEQEGEES